MKLVERAAPETAPDQWAAIRSKLVPRPAGLGWWLRVHRLQTALAGAAAAVVLSAWLVMVPHPEPIVEAQGYVTNHASMSWNEPFADRAGLGLAEAIPVKIGAEAGH